MRERESDLESLIKQTLHENVDRIPAPVPSGEGWDRLFQELKRHRAERSMQRWKQGAAVAAAVLALVVGLAVFAVPGKVGAAGQKVIHIFKEKIGESLRITSIFNDDDATPANPDTVNPDGRLTRGPRTVTLEEAEALTPYDLKVPEYLPEGMELAEVKIKEMSGATVEVRIIYRGLPGELQIQETNMVIETMEAGNSRKEDIHEVSINGVAGMMITKNNATRLQYNKDGITFVLMILGDQPIDEIIKVGESIR
ncbi:MAG: DUF4367 domain-containing protein [Bacillota bacterium]